MTRPVIRFLPSPAHRTLLHGIAALICSAVGAQAPAACPINQSTQPYIEEIVTKLSFDTAFVVANVHFRDRGFALSFFGVDQGTLGQLLLEEQCTEPRTFEPFYDHLDGGITTFSQVVCEARGVEIVKFAAATTNDEDISHFRRLTYNAARYIGRVMYQPYPSVDWRTIALGPGDFSVNAALFRRLVFNPVGGAPVDLTHFGSLSGRISDDQAVSTLIYAVFPALLASGKPLAVNIETNEHGVASGNLTVAGRTIATISGTGFEPVIRWRGECASRNP